ncbi:metalloregulator ArsR/SmtB family transcription factor [Microbacterium sp. KSW2-29]|uniref:Metalloregulator ArsR/SmtB family transcription factor n=1 Tax=Microbacterium phycohabitans TaxID=3075993 RepID=A0ABU3SJP6_9MICO|nr:metalloregulator ArsR/SmtB family transcription factor [Microbacterium sp. KSW2-29]MDU0344607.1 metalloregulator ArsR/SmtB family transcription factor [Microbacterium sp. KSW2-29]
MDAIEGLDEAAELFKVLGSESRLALVWLLNTEQLTVGALAAKAGLSQPLVSQHLRTLRQAGLVTSERDGKEIRYALADQHVAHVVLDAIAHVTEPTTQGNEQ